MIASVGSNYSAAVVGVGGKNIQYSRIAYAVAHELGHLLVECI